MICVNIEHVSGFCTKKISKKLCPFCLPIICAFFFSLTVSAWAQRLQRFGLEEGLPQSSINCITQDQKGFLWVGTQDGLARFDGRGFRVFGKDEGISNLFITSILEDKHQYLWVGTEDGLFMLAPNRLELVEFKNENNDPYSISNNYIHSLYQDSTGAVWVGTRNGLDRFDRSLKKFSRRGKFNVLSIAKWQHNKVWLGTAEGLLLFDTKLNKVLQTYRHSPTDPNTLKNDMVTSIFATAKRLYVGTGGGFCWLDIETQRFITSKMQGSLRQLNSIVVQSIVSLSPASLLVATLGGGLHKFDMATNKATYFEGKGITTDRVNALYYDNQQGLWIGTEDGLYLHHPLNQFFHTIKPATQGALEDNVFSMTYDLHNKLWIAYENHGVVKFDEKKNQLERIKRFPKQVYYLYADKNELWISFLGSNIGRLNLKNDSLEYFNFRKLNPNSTLYQILAIEQKSEDELYLCLAPLGLVCFNKQNYKSTLKSNDALGIKSQYYEMTAMKKKDNWLWLGTFREGLVAWNQKSDSVLHFNKLSGLADNKIAHLFIDSKRQLWVGSTGGLSLFDPITKSFRSFTRREGLPSNTVYSIAEDRAGNLWLGTNNGLCRFTPPQPRKNSVQTLNFDMKDGLPSREFNAGVTSSGTSTNVYFGSTKGVVYFNPDSLHTNDFDPPVAITNFAVMGKPVPNVFSDTLIKLPHNQNFFSFTFAALSFYRSDKNQYAFQLAGLDKGWVYAGTENKANYTFVPPGNYTFRVKASNNQGLWGSKSVAIKVVVLPPWWRTWWAYMAYGVSFVFAVLFVIRRRTRQLKEQNLRLEKKVAERTDQLEEANQELVTTMENLKTTQQQLIESEKMASLGLLTAGIAHEINNPLNFISSGAQGLKEVLAEIKELAQVDEATKNEVAALLQCVDIGVERAANIVKSLRLYASPQQAPQEITDIDLKECAESSLVLLSAKVSDHAIEVVKKYHPTKRVKGNNAQLSQVVVNLLDNAVFACSKVDRQRIITLTIEQVEDTVVIRIADNGIGIPKSQQRKIFNPFFTTKEVGLGTGLGLYISYGIIKNHHGQITFTSTEGQGSEFNVMINV